MGGVFLMLGAYAGSAMGRMDPQKAPALLCNLTGALLVLLSLSRNFNLSAVVLESAWALVAVAGLIRLALGRRA